MVFRKPHFRWRTKSLRHKTNRWIVDDPATVYNDAVYPQLPFLIRAKRYNMKYKADNTLGGQLYNLTFAVTDLFRDERVVMSHNKATEIRGHVERLIVEAMRNGDKHRPTMDLANFWLREKNLIHKLFKVFVPRYEDYATAFTAIHRLGRDYSLAGLPMKEKERIGCWYKPGGESIIEMRGNILPPIKRPSLYRPGLLSNVLLDSARESYFKEAAAREASKRVE